MTTDKLKPIGKYVHLVDERNSDLGISKLVGLTIEKRYIASVANIIGTDLSKYKIIRKGRFACSLMQVSRDKKMPVAMYDKDEPAILSPAYPMFEVNDEEELMPEYLNMYLMREEFDREAVFYAVGGVRGSLEWDDFMAMKMPIPDIKEQRRIVDEYKAIEKRIDNNNSLIKKLEKAAQAIYYHTSVENIDPDNLPDGWEVGVVNDICKVYSGKSISDKYDDLNGNHNVPVAGATGIIGYADTYNQNEELLTTGRVGTLGVVNRYYEPIWAADNVLVIKSKYINYAYQVLSKLDYNLLTKPGVQSLITKTELENYQITVPSDSDIELYNNKVSPIFDSIHLSKKEVDILKKIKSLLLYKLS